MHATLITESAPRSRAGDRPRLLSALTSSAATASITRGYRQRISDELRRRSGLRICRDGHENELASLMNVCHRDSGLHSGYRDLSNILTGLFVVSMEQRIRAIACEEQGLRDEDSDQPLA